MVPTIFTQFPRSGNLQIPIFSSSLPGGIAQRSRTESNVFSYSNGKTTGWQDDKVWGKRDTLWNGSFVWKKCKMQMIKIRRRFSFRSVKNVHQRRKCVDSSLNIKRHWVDLPIKSVPKRDLSQSLRYVVVEMCRGKCHETVQQQKQRLLQCN